MNRSSLFLVGAIGCFSLVMTAGCGDSGGTGSGGGGTGGAGQGGDGTTATGMGGDMTTTTTGMAATCAAYCATMDTACAGANEQYVTTAACQAECAAFMQGTAGDMGMNTLECRSYHAGVAAGADPQVHCVHAGPLGGAPAPIGDGCGDNRCSSYCKIVMEICGGVATPPYATEDACKTDCANFPDTAAFNIGVTTGNTLACRMYHLSVASQAGEAELHCAHTKMNGGPCNP